MLEQNKMYSGGEFPDNFEFAEGQMIKALMDGTYGLITWHIDNVHMDFAIISKSGLDNGVTYNISCDKTEEMESMATCKHSGSAGGFVIPSQSRLYDQKSCTDCTKKTEFFKTWSWMFHDLSHCLCQPKDWIHCKIQPSLQ